MFKKILAYVDGSEVCEQMLDYVMEQAVHFGSKVILLAVNSIPVTTLAYASPDQFRMMPALLPDKLIMDANSKAQSTLRKTAIRLAEKGIDVECATEMGPVDATIVRYAREKKADLITMTAQAYKGWKRWLMGSVVDNVLRECGVPVLVISPVESHALSAA
ncbi:MAG: universal stress protein [Dehalococcoidia bacterium]|nr:universal stress protein [Dehalococcoidia bacterium]